MKHDPDDFSRRPGETPPSKFTSGERYMSLAEQAAIAVLGIAMLAALVKAAWEWLVG